MVTARELEYWESKPTVAYSSEWNGLEIKDIEYGIEDYVVGIADAWHGIRRFFRAEIRYDSEEDRSYFIACGHRFYLDECLRYWRIDPESVPTGKHFYESADYDGTGDICRIQEGVLVNFWGTIITCDPIPLEDNGRAYPDDVNYLGYCGYLEDEEKEYEN